MMNDDMELVREYAARQSEQAFETLVSRNVGLVHSAALRQLRDPHLAEEITQTVFIILARKAGSLNPKTILAGWLYRTTRYVSAAALKIQRRREHLEQEAQMEALTQETQTDPAWEQFSPLLDEAMANLRDKDRDAIVLRYFQNRSLRDVGAALGVDEYAAQKRVARALEKLRAFFVERGVDSTTATIGEAISANSIQVAPALLAKTATAAAIAKGAATSTSTLTLIKGALKIMAWTKAKAAIVVGAGVLLAAGTTTITVKEIQEHRTYPWQGREGVINSSDLNQPPQVKIVPSRFHKPGIYTGDKLLGKGLSVQTVVANAYGYTTPARAVFSVRLPTDLYDYIACLPGGEAANEAALQSAVKRKFGVVGKIETRDADVWLLKTKFNAGALKRHTGSDDGNGSWPITGGLRFYNDSMDNLTATLEFGTKIPVIDGTALTNTYDFDLNCAETDIENRNWTAMNQALDQLGLELVSTNMPIEMLVVEKVQ
jgi:uncharacterized protein (TIGR03435 family)